MEWRRGPAEDAARQTLTVETADFTSQICAGPSQKTTYIHTSLINRKTGIMPPEILSVLEKRMKVDDSVKVLLLVIAVALGAIAVRPYFVTPSVAAQSGEAGPYYVEPGVTILRAPDGSQQVLGKVVVDLRNGNIWGFPTMTQDPYPAAGAKTTPPVSHPFLLGKFALADIAK